MRIEPLGDRALLVRDLTIPAAAFAEALNAAGLPEVEEAVASYATVGVYGDVAALGLDVLAPFEAAVETPPGRERPIPVCYEMGEDLEETATRLNLPPEELARIHAGTVYTCYAVGFCPGFPYLGDLPDRIAGVPRRPEPRLRVAPGSVAITGRQTGIYPLERPGGWAILGRTPLTLVDVEDGYFPIRSGDRVRFVPIDMEEFHARRGERL